MMTRSRRQGERGEQQTRIAFVWDQLAPYCLDRSEAVAGQGFDVLCVQFAERSRLYAWEAAAEAPDNSTRVVTLCRAVDFESTRVWQRLSLLVHLLFRHRVDVLFLSNYQRVDVALAALVQRFRGRRAFVMFDSKFDDKARHAWREVLKRPMLMVYTGAIASGTRSVDYLRFLGLADENIATGYDTVRVARVQSEATQAASRPVPFNSRPFVVVARLVEKKAIETALQAYAAYVTLCVESERLPRRLVICGDGPLLAPLRGLQRRLGLQDGPDGVSFKGWKRPQELAAIVRGSIALIVPSVEEQWGLVVNEAVALNVPVICTTAVGARDLLVRSGVNGYLFEPGNVKGCAEAMYSISCNESVWSALSDGALQFWADADVSHFAAGVVRLLGDRR